MVVLHHLKREAAARGQRLGEAPESDAAVVGLAGSLHNRGYVEARWSAARGECRRFFMRYYGLGIDFGFE